MIAHGDRACPGDNRIESRRTKTIQRDGRDAVGEAGNQTRHPRDIPIVFARLIGAAGIDLAQIAWVDPSSLHQRQKTLGKKVVWTYVRQATTDLTDGRSKGIDDENVTHGKPRHAVYRSPPDLFKA
jgi:hypothetical protein